MSDNIIGENMKIDVDLTKLVDVDLALKAKVEELIKENTKLNNKLNSYTRKIVDRNNEINRLAYFEDKYNELKNKVNDFLKLED